MKASEVKKAKEVVDDFLAKLGVSETAKVFAVEEYLKVEIEGKDSPILIGYHGETLRALRHILSLVLKREINDDIVVSVDVAHYLERKEDRIRDIAKKAIEKVKNTGRPTKLPPMNAYEQRLAHSYITDQGYISESEGEGLDRRIVIKKQ